MMMNYRLLAVLLVSAFVVSPSVVENAFAKTKKKLTYEQAFAKCKEDVNRTLPTEYHSAGRYARGASCMKQYGYHLKKSTKW